MPLSAPNRSDFCDLRLRCPSRTPEIASDFRDKSKQSDLSFEPGFGAYQSLAQKMKVPFSMISLSFCSFEGSSPISKPAPNPGTHQTPVETLAEAVLHCDLRVRWKVASDLRFGAAISEPETPSFCGISGDLGPSHRVRYRLRFCDSGALSRAP